MEMILINWLNILAAIMIFSLLILVHELGHFLAARSFGVKVNEFAIGMGPTLLKKQKGQTLYSVRAFPIGGFCAMEGEDQDSKEPGSFGSKKPWQRFIILFAGAFMNFLIGFIIVTGIEFQYDTISTTQINSFQADFEAQSESGLQVGDTILSVNGNNIYIFEDLSMFLDRYSEEPYDITVLRGGEKVTLSGLSFVRKPYEIEGNTYMLYGINFAKADATFFGHIKSAWLTSIDYFRLVRLGLTDLITGNANSEDLMGPVGIVDTINTVTSQVAGFGAKLLFLLNLAALITVNLAVVNLLPLPALDGGRIIFVLIEMIRRKPINQKYESYVHMIGFALLMALMVYVSFNDITRIISRAAGG